MCDLTERIAAAEEWEMDMLLRAILLRYEELFPDRERSVLVIEKSADRKEQIDKTIRLLEKRKMQ